MKETIFILVGLIVGFDLGIGCAWWTLRRSTRASEVVDRIKSYTGS